MKSVAIAIFGLCLAGAARADEVPVPPRADGGTPGAPSAPPEASAPASSDGGDVAAGAVDGGSAPVDSPAPAAPAVPPAPVVEDVPKGDTGEKPPGGKVETRTNGYIDSRFTYTHVNTGHLLPTQDIPGFANLTEGNFQLKLTWGDKAVVYTDTSFVYQYGTDFRNASGSVADHDVASLEPVAIVSEAYALYNFTDHLNLLLGKKRIVWGPGYAYNPTDILNPAKDPTDPTFQRAGAWMARLEVPFRTWTLSFVGSPQVLRTYGGLPSAMLFYPNYPTANQQAITNATNGTVTYGKPDNAPHFAAAARAYWLVGDTDLNLFYYYTNVYNDEFQHKSRVGTSASHVFGNWELHFEGLFQEGYSDFYANPACVSSTTALESCYILGQTVAGYTGLGSTTFVAKLLFGARYQLDNNGILSFEYYYNGEGYTPAEFQQYVTLVRYGESASSLLPASQQFQIPTGPTQDPGLPEKYVFNPLRRHYLFINYQQPQIHDDWTVAATMILDLEDLSGLFAPSVTWTPVEWLNLTIGGFVGIPGVSSWGASIPGGSFTGPPATGSSVPQKVEIAQTSYTEFGVLPFDWEVYFAVRAFY